MCNLPETIHRGGNFAVNLADPRFAQPEIPALGDSVHRPLQIVLLSGTALFTELVRDGDGHPQILDEAAVVRPGLFVGHQLHGFQDGMVQMLAGAVAVGACNSWP